jgi:hypothetical protein
MYGVYGVKGVLLVIVFIAIIDFIRKLSRNTADKITSIKLPKKQPPLDELEVLKSHLLFTDIDNNINTNIGNIHFTCQVRKAVFSDMLKFRMEVLRDELLSILNSDDYLNLSDPEFKVVWKQLENNVVSKWTKRCLDAEIPDFIIGKMDRVYKDKVEIINSLIDSVCDDTVTNSSVYTKTDQIFDILRAVHYALIINTLEDTLKIINGDFAGVSYHKLTCPGPSICTIQDCPAKKHQGADII